MLLLLLERTGPLPSRIAVSIKSTTSGIPADCSLADSDAEADDKGGVALLVLSDACTPFFEGDRVLLESEGGILPSAGLGAAREFAATAADSYGRQ